MPSHTPHDSIFAAALGDRFTSLHPKLQEFFGLAPGSGKYLVGTGTFDVAGSPRAWLRPALHLAVGDESFFPEYGTNVPFTLEAHAHLDPFHRPSLTMVRQLGFPGVNRTFRDTTSLSAHGLVDYLGDSQRIATGVTAMVGPGGSFRSVSDRTRFFLPVQPSVLRVPGPLDARAYTWQRFNEATGQFHIQVKVQNPVLGTLFEYAGNFTALFVDYPSHEAASHGVPNVLPGVVSPKRWEAHV